MPVTAYPFSHGAALEALRSAKENLRLIWCVYPEINEKAMDEVIHSISGASRRVFESYVRETRRSSEEVVNDEMLQAV